VPANSVPKCGSPAWAKHRVSVEFCTFESGTLSEQLDAAIAGRWTFRLGAQWRCTFLGAHSSRWAGNTHSNPNSTLSGSETATPTQHRRSPNYHWNTKPTLALQRITSAIREPEGEAVTITSNLTPACGMNGV
jgi:hypothetical protein